MLTDLQFSVLAAHIRANLDPSVAAALALGDHTTIADWYNEDSSTTVWRPSVSPREYTAVFDWREIDALTVGAARAFEWMTNGLQEPINSGAANVRAGISDIFPANGNGAAPITRAALIALAQRMASRFEDIFVIDTGGTEELVVEGPLTIAEVGKALNRF